MAQPDRVEAYARAFFEVARTERRVEAVENDLFRFSRAFDANDQLRMALSDRTVPAERRVAVIEELMGGAALPTSVGLVAMVVGADRAGDLPAIVDRFLELSAAARQRDVAEVRSAVPLDDQMQERLARALGEAVGKQVEVKVVVDPTVLGGVMARVGDIVIDGTIRHRLEELKERIAS
ncbi:MAG: ATP synthase F1 subunit delta [Actinomycetota bacterium]|nr:ATP synthase F1 subunit delta [Actinomycetota bacterium]